MDRLNVKREGSQLTLWQLPRRQLVVSVNFHSLRGFLPQGIYKLEERV